MGASVSRSLDLNANEYLEKFVGKERIGPNDPFWNRFLTFNIDPPMTSNDQLALESRIEGLCQRLSQNNPQSGNLGVAIDIFNLRASELLIAADTDSNLYNWQLFNTIFIIKCILKFLTEMTSEEQLIAQIEAGGDGTRLEAFIGSLMEVSTDVPVLDSTYFIHLEAITCMLILLSVQQQNHKKSDQSVIYRQIMKGKHAVQAPLFMKSLLTNFISYEKAPPPFGNNHGHSVVLGIAAELWSMLTFNRKTEDVPETNQNDYQTSPLGTQSLLLILVLAHHWTTQINPYRLNLFTCLDSQDAPKFSPAKEITLFKINYAELYNILCKKVIGDSATLLLYLLIHRNITFKTYLLQRLDLENLVVPILKTLYNAPNSNSHHIYMSLIILLILSEDDDFNKCVHETKLRNVPWYTERTLNDISLGGLLILIVIRTIQYNMLKMRDKYLHTNCLAALANMSAQFRDLHPYVSQRLVSLFETLAKRYQRLVGKLEYDKEGNHVDVTVSISQDEDNMEKDLNVLEEVLRMVLEIINSCLSNQLLNNPNLVYTLLYKKHIFQQFKNNIVFQDIIFNINIILDYFSGLLEDKSQQYEVDAVQVLHVIQNGAKNWPKEKLVKFPELKFKYVEEDQPEEFFIPYVWELVNKHSILRWTNENSVSTIC